MRQRDAVHRVAAVVDPQLPADEVDAFERCGPSGHACNRYWLLSPIPTVVDDQAERALLVVLAHVDNAAGERIVGHTGHGDQKLVREVYAFLGHGRHFNALGIQGH